ncbi:replication protein [Legionella quinlivanii]|uniref:replication protein n=1 Tax=Legionella quinlivanii TaxID=45073 RepID=UPI002244567B|nr:replication protein [Legionella quinlivanii]MCW8452541.1 replication protein [Legionella quinlivanii]
MNMAVLRIHKKQQNFLILDKTCLNDMSLSWGAKGLHTYLMSLPDDWRVRVTDLKERATNGRDAVRNLIKELEETGYIQKSICRHEENGRFGGIEYLVLEIPVITNDELLPPVKEGLSKNPGPSYPAPENPSLENPGLEKTTLINNKYTKDPYNQGLIKKTAAEINLSTGPYRKSTKSQAAAAVEFFDLRAVNRPKETTRLSSKDAMISDKLTQNQILRIEQLISGIQMDDKAGLLEEISYCLLSKKHFSACGLDFSRKLNAIQTVIAKGHWQTPVELISEKKQTLDSTTQALEQNLCEAHAEANHFKKLLSSAAPNQRTSLNQLIRGAEEKILKLGQLLLQAKLNNQAAF